MPISERWYTHPKDCPCPDCSLQKRRVSQSAVQTHTETLYYCNKVCKRYVDIDIGTDRKISCTNCGNKVQRKKVKRKTE